MSRIILLKKKKTKKKKIFTEAIIREEFTENS